MAKEVKLLGAWPSPYVLRVQIALELKGVSYEYSEQQLWENKSELLLRSNPVNKKVPVLIHKEQPIWESAIILQYIDEVWGAGGPAILPSDPYERAIACFWASYIDDKWGPSSIGILRGKTDEERAAAAEQAFSGLELLEEAYEKSFKGKRFFGGDNVGYLDIVLGCFLGWIEVVDIMFSVKLFNNAKFPLLAGWAERFRAAAEVKKLMPEAKKLMEFAKAAQARMTAAAAN
ncbi:glutathione S-transferase U17-like [Ananas comosus]|uniref:glutathione transferase n=1 Tax=Ananas comosus TaxID=4615 RepID=A0A199VSA6_ANACO|nr:glutathione S-transferase U17-like [Ananas comosus]OAY79801.1 Glutathione S-transferase U17 [Ananas comosus]